MTSNELREKYLKFFESKGHLIHPSDSLVPDDPSLLFTSAGMVQFKPYFVGDRVPPNTRIVTSQKCLRTDDIDEVGDAVHHTFFEMLGNFSFDDYFKRESIIWAWEFLTEVLKINPDHLWTSVYLDDDEAYDIWVNEVKFPPERIVRLGEDKNYWPANAPSKGPTGVCGPCNEIFLDVTPELGPPEDAAWAIAHDGNRFVEIWNLVFTQFYRQDDGTMTPLPSKNIDTGMGLERTIAVLQETETDYETDLFLPIVRRIESLSGAKYGGDETVTRSIRIIADHIRAAVFAIGDGVMPSNIGRGYVLRRLIRNAVVAGRNLGLEKNFMTAIVPVVVELMGGVYHEIADRQAYIEKVVGSEEDKFRRTLDAGFARLTELIDSARCSQDKKIDGAAAFTLYDTYGFPIELTQENAAGNGVEVDMEGFQAAMEEQRKRAKEASDFGSVMIAGGGSVILELEKTVEPTRFVGYENLESEARVLAILQNGEMVSVASLGDTVEVVLDATPFYAESGGQAGDAGDMLWKDGELYVYNTTKAGCFFLHRSLIKEGKIIVGQRITCRVRADQRMDTARNHTATHLLHAALRKILGEHALQAGSDVDCTRLRFDFSHFQAVTEEELQAIEYEVNQHVLDDMPVEVIETNVSDARKMGATALFGEKYGERVRVIKIGDYSIELCGGTHLQRTSQVELFKITSESSIGAGLRRIEAVTGHGALRYVNEMEDTLREAAEKLQTRPAEVPDAIERLQASLKDVQRQLEQLQARSASEQAQELAAGAQEVAGVKVVTTKLGTADVNIMRTLADNIADRLQSGVVILGGVSDGRIMFVGKVTRDLVERGFHAGNMLREVAKTAGGGGGGKPDFAQAGGKDASKVDEALQVAVDLVRKQAQ